MFKIILYSAIALVAALVVGFLILNEPRPDGETGPEADALARKMMAAVHHALWDSTGAVRWNLAGKRQHLWDRKRNFARVRWGENEVLIDLTSKHGIARRGKKLLPEVEAKSLVEAAWKKWCNDTFWLNPISKSFDDGTTRSVVKRDSGDDALLITFTTGGVTPGDAFLWIIDDDGLPQAWKMWVSIIPVGGVEASWENWQTLATGVRVSTLHHTAFFDIRLTDVAGAATLAALEPGDDPFKALVENSK